MTIKSVIYFVLFFIGLTTATQSYADKKVSSSLDDASNYVALVVVIEGIESDRKGDLNIAVFDNKKHWLNSDKFQFAKKIPVTDKASVNLRFDSLQIGREYAVAVIHDENSNGKMDRKGFSFIPAEGVGVSNNYFGFGPPSYKKAKLVLTNNHKIVIKLNYFK